MRKLFFSLIFGLFAISLQAQVMIDFDNFSRYRNVRMKLTLVDSQSKEPIEFASVYLIPQNDTIITQFAMSDAKGKVEIKDIVAGKYQVNAELLGYKSYQKIHNLNDYMNDLGVIEMEEDTEFIDAATITAIGNAVTIKKDTIIYNASSFRVGNNDMLGDLLKKMPGMEVAEDGTVTVNGEKVDKITVGGKTFFFNDPAMAVKNLPAKVVDKIKVVDKKKDEAEFSGISTNADKEKVMDLEFKEEYKQGWFGNLKAGGGVPLRDKDDNEMSGEMKGLFNISGLAAAYSDKDQVTIIANGRNVDDYSSGMVTVYNNDQDEFNGRMGLSTSAQAGVNYNTERLKGLESTANISYNFMDKDAREKSHRTSFQADGSTLDTDGSYTGRGRDNKVSGSIELKNKNRDKYLFALNAALSYSTKDRSEHNNSTTKSADRILNSTQAHSTSHSGLINTGIDLGFGIKNLGKEKRSLSFNSYFSLTDSKGNSTDYSQTILGSDTDVRNLLYDNKGNSYYGSAELAYAEPLGQRWALQATVSSNISGTINDKAAFDGSYDAANDYYSSYVNTKSTNFTERLLAQYEKDQFKAVAGLQIDQQQDEQYSSSLGVENRTGKGEWTVNFAPYADIEWNMDNTSLSFYAQGFTDTPTGTRVSPALNISNPVQISVGNVYLKTAYQQYMGLNFNHNNPKNFSNISVHAGSQLGTNQVVYASWFDENGVRYAIPVNSEAPSFSVQSYIYYRTPLNKKKTLNLTVSGNINYTENTNYQAKGHLPGLDKENFDYNETMEWFWGNASGNKFYSGESGFGKSLTNTFTYAFGSTFDYKIGGFSFDLGAYFNNSISKYSLDKTANNNIWSNSVNGGILWNNEKGWEIKTNANYNFYKGYSNGYGTPEFVWNFKLSKEVKAVTFSLSVNDILNQRKSSYGQMRQTSAEYVQDSYYNTIGRYILFGLSFNFGKMNAANQDKARSAMWHMLY